MNGELISLLTILIMLVSVVGLAFIGYKLLFSGRKNPELWQVKLRSKLSELHTKNHDTKQLILEYDKLYAFALKHKFNLHQETLGQILKLRAGKFDRQELNAIWDAHKIRNRLAHDIDYKPGQSELNKAMIVLKRAVEGLLHN